jgi:hypothetical protein
MTLCKVMHCLRLEDGRLHRAAPDQIALGPSLAKPSIGQAR